MYLKDKCLLFNNCQAVSGRRSQRMSGSNISLPDGVHVSNVGVVRNKSGLVGERHHLLKADKVG